VARLAAGHADEPAGVGGESVGDGLDQLLLGERLQQVRRGPCGQSLLGEASVAGQRDDRDVALAADEPGGVDTA
jgi:hypothetical protein